LRQFGLFELRVVVIRGDYPAAPTLSLETIVELVRAGCGTHDPFTGSTTSRLENCLPKRAGTSHAGPPRRGTPGLSVVASDHRQRIPMWSK